MKPWEYMQLIYDARFRKQGPLKVDWAIQYVDGHKVLMFLGSTDKIDWVLNFLCAFIPFWLYKKYLVSIGWALAWKSVRNSVCTQFTADDKDVTIIGHSYGSAMAVLAGEELNYRYCIKPKLITFGSVRPLLTGIKHFRECFTSIEQYAHRGDFVCLCPPFFRRLGTIKIGESINIFKTCVWHNDYANYAHYKELCK